MHDLLAFFAALPSWLVYSVLGLGAATENVIPPVPADTFVLLGGVLVGRGVATAAGVFAVTWTLNVASAMAVYALGRKYGPGFFNTGAGRWILHPGQMDRVQSFYDKLGVPAILFTRFLPALRAVVPVFAGITKQPVRSVLPPIALASAIWYGALIWAGVTMGRNLNRVANWLSNTNTVLLGVALVLFVAIVVWWRSTRTGGTSGEVP